MGVLRWLSKLGYYLISPTFLCDKQLVDLERECCESLRYRWFYKRKEYGEPVDADDIEKAFKRYYGLSTVNFMACDTVYLEPKSPDILLEWIRLDWTDLKPYLTEHWDCDDFAMLFVVRTRMITGWGFTWTVGEIRREDTGELIGYHAWVTTYQVDKKGELIVRAMEPQTDELSDTAVFPMDLDGDGNYEPVKYRPIPVWPQVTV